MFKTYTKQIEIKLSVIKKGKKKKMMNVLALLVVRLAWTLLTIDPCAHIRSDLMRIIKL